MSDSAEMATQIEANVERAINSLTVWARHMAARYKATVYLAGSTLHHPTPRDCDIRIVVDDHEFAARYGNALHHTEITAGHPLKKRSSLVSASLVRWNEDGPTQRWIDDVAKFNAHLSVKLGLNMDVQVVPDSWWRDGIYPAPIVLAAPTPSWFVYTRHCPDPSESASARARPASEPPDAPRCTVCGKQATRQDINGEWWPPCEHAKQIGLRTLRYDVAGETPAGDER